MEGFLYFNHSYHLEQFYYYYYLVTFQSNGSSYIQSGPKISLNNLPEDFNMTVKRLYFASSRTAAAVVSSDVVSYDRFQSDKLSRLEKTKEIKTSTGANETVLSSS